MALTTCREKNENLVISIAMNQSEKINNENLQK